MTTMGTNSGTNRKSELAYERFTADLGGRLLSSERMFERLDDEDISIVAIRARFPTSESPDYLVTVKAMVEGQAVVGFHGGETFHEALGGVLTRLQNRTMKWRSDQYV